MATNSTAGARASRHDRRLWVLIAAAVAVLVLAFVLHSARSGQKSAEQQIGEQVYAGTGCLTTVSSNRQVARRWPQAAKAEIIVCQTSESDQFANYVMDYAQWKSPSARSTVLKAAPPDGSYCTIGSAVVTLDDSLDTFRTMCAHRGGAFHARAAG